ncbi:MAG: DUF349 domain-containing protein [Flavobacteriales bacterium]|nr:DUF349 domain-containing protein [Flavobacteriales bacterium]
METQEQIIARMEELLTLPVDETMREANELKSSFYAMNHEKLEKQKEEHREIGARMEDFVPIPNPLEDKFKELFSRYRDMKAKYVHQKEEEEKKNYAEKVEILKGLKELIDNEESIGKSFDRFKDFQDKWKAVGPVPSGKAADLNNDYRAEVDRFYYNININKELKEYDLAKNLEIRDAIVKKLEELQSADVIKDIQLILDAAKEEWEDAGPVKPEVFQELRDRYYEAVRTLHKKIQDFYTERKEEMQTNLEAKQQMVARVLELAANEAKSIGKWNKMTEEVMKLRDEWKEIGMVERKHHKSVWDEFKKAQDAFFDKKKEFFGEAKEAFNENREAKEKLIARAEELKVSEDWKETTEKFKRLQNEWKRIGSAGTRDENKLWNKFRGICDEFFNRKKAWFDGKEDRELANLKAKEELLKKMAEAKLEGSDEEKLAAIKAFGDEFAALGFVPKKDISRLEKAYDVAIDKLYLSAGLKKDEVKKVRFQNKIERLAEGDRGGDQLRKEQNFLSKKLREKEEELRQYETNMSFFANAAPDNPLLVNAQKNIESLKVEIESLQEKIKLLKISQRKMA